MLGLSGLFIKIAARDNPGGGGGPEEIRTLDLTDANRALSQLSYEPLCDY